MFAVIKTGGKQYKVAVNDVLKFEKLAAHPGEVILFDEVLAVTDAAGKVTLGTPRVSNVKVSAEVLENIKDDKVIVFKKKRRHNYRRKKGHRQNLTVVRIQGIGADLKAKAAPEKKAETAAPAAKKAKKAPAKKAAAPKKSAEAKAEAKQESDKE